MITYTVFDPDDASRVTYRWYGADDSTVYVYVDGGEYDAFELEDVGAPTAASVSASVATYHEEHHAGRASGPPPDED